MSEGPRITKRVQEILGYYQSDAPSIRVNLARLLMSGRLAGTGKLLILPVDQGFEHGPARSFAANPAGYDPLYHFELAIDAGCNAYAAPLGFLEVGAAEYAGHIPLILKLNNSDSLFGGDDYNQAVTGSVQDALRLGCCAVGYTIYPGSSYSHEMYENLQEIAEEAKSVGLAVVVWSYPRGGKLNKAGETAIDVVCYAAQIAAQLGAHIIKVKVPTDHIYQPEAKRSMKPRTFRSVPRSSESVTWCKVRSTGDASSFSPGAPRVRTRPFSTKCGRFAMGEVSVRSSAGILSNARNPMP